MLVTRSLNCNILSAIGWLPLLDRALLNIFIELVSFFQDSFETYQLLMDSPIF